MNFLCLDPKTAQPFTQAIDTHHMLKKKKTAIILYQQISDSPGFRYSAKFAKRYLEKKGFKVFWDIFAEKMPTLERIPRFNKQVDLLIWYSHGGWDGPLVLGVESTPDHAFNFQISPHEPEEFVQLMTYFKQELKPQGVFLSHSCHAAGSTPYEYKDLPDNRNWIKAIATHMKIYTFGAAGSVSSGNVHTARGMLDFIFTGTNLRKHRAYAPGGNEITHKRPWPIHFDIPSLDERYRPKQLANVNRFSFD